MFIPESRVVSELAVGSGEQDKIWRVKQLSVLFPVSISIHVIQKKTDKKNIISLYRGWEVNIFSSRSHGVRRIWSDRSGFSLEKRQRPSWKANLPESSGTVRKFISVQYRSLIHSFFMRSIVFKVSDLT